MTLDELKDLRKKNFSNHKKKKKAYYLKNKALKEGNKVEIDYAEELNTKNFHSRIRAIAKAQKEHVDDRKDLIVAKINQYKKNKKEYYAQNKNKRLEYDKEYREKKKEDLKAYRKKYYQENKEKILAKQKDKRKKL